MSLNSLYKKFDDYAHWLFRYKYAKKSSKYYKKNFKNNGITLRRLTPQQKQEVLKTWKTLKNIDFETHELYYSLTGVFDPKICPELYFRTIIDPVLNDRKINLAWNDKCYFDRFIQNVKLPDTYIRNVNGVYYDHDYNIITKEQAKVLIKQNGNGVIKPSMETGLGKNVKIVDAGEDLDAVLDSYRENFIVQKIIKQHPEMAKLNPKSVNIMRMNTMFINGEVRFLTASVRAGLHSNIAANSYSTKGDDLAIIGVNNDGSLKEFAFFPSGKTLEILPNGTVIKDITIPEFDKAIEEVIRAHAQLGHFGVLAWDVTIDEDANPVIIEYNLNGMGVLYYQLVTGPLFGEYTEEVAKYIKNRM